MATLFSLRSGSTTFLFLLLALPFFINAQPALKCGTADSTLIPILERHFGDITRLKSARTTMGEPLVYRLAVDVNYNTYLLYRRDKIRISEVVHQFIEKASQVFEKEINIRLVVTDLLIWDTPEPYPLVNDMDYYSNINDYWVTRRPGERDCVVSLSVRYGWFYGGGRMCSSNFPDPNNTLQEVDLLCHELGHTLGSPHTHSCFWPGGPIDVCADVEGQSSDCQAPFTDNVNGTIMSYCRNVMEFHPFCRNLMRDYAEGKVQEVYFALRGFSPAASVSLSLSPLYQPEFSPAPAFSWHSTYQTEAFRLQVAHDAAFTRLAEDIVTRQPFYHSAEFPQGIYFVRVRAESGGQTGPWSPALSFEMPGFAAHRAPPVLVNPVVSGNSLATVSFRNEPHADAYQIQVINPYSGMVVSTAEGQTDPGPVQEVRFFSYYEYNQVRLRVRYGEEWSEWSAFPPNFFMEPANRLHPATSLTHTSATPFLSYVAISGYWPSSQLIQYLEIAPDAGFNTIVARDSVRSNEINQYPGNKIRFSPELGEKERYFLRTRTRYGPGAYSEWMPHTLETGRLDRRFTYTGSLSKFSNSFINFAEMAPQGRFLKSGNRLYVYGNYTSGYYVTSDLQSWQEVTGRTTVGKVPRSYFAFGVAPSGDVWMLQQPASIVIAKADGGFEYSRLSRDFYLYEAALACVTPDHGMFFIIPGLGIARVLNGDLSIFGQETFPSPIPVTMADGPEGSIWALMRGGAVYVFREGSWSFHSQFPYWNMGGAFSFSPGGAPLLYGEFGAAGFDNGGWENIGAVKGLPIRKAVFDEKGQLWMASYRSSGPLSYESYGLLKLKNGKLTSYTDGLNFLQEPFDLEFFNGKLVIMTTGGEIHTFDETQIQRFGPAEAYCQGGEVAVTITSNSSFGAGNRFTLELIHRETGKSEWLNPSVEEGDILKATLPGTLPEGVYTLRTLATQPELTSNESIPFKVYSSEKPRIVAEASGNFKQRLSTVALEGYTYQWLFNDEPVPGGTSPELEAAHSGTYVLTAVNGVCAIRSDEIVISLPDPGKLTLLQNAPNPFSEATGIAFYLPVSQHATLELFDLNGRKIAVLKEDFLPQGWHEVPFDGGALTAGVYVYRLTTPNGKLSLKAVKN